MRSLALVLLIILVSTSTSEASMSDRIIQGDIHDPRISACGLAVNLGSMASLRPFIETSSALSGTVRLRITKRSASGASQTSQSWGFSSGTLGTSRVDVDLPARLFLQLDVADSAGHSLCRLQQELVLDMNSMPA